MSSGDVASSSSRLSFSSLHPHWLSPQWFARFLLLLVFVNSGLICPTWTPHSAGRQAAAYWLGWGSPWPVPPLHLGVPTGWNTAARHPTATLRLSLLRLFPGRCYCCCCHHCCCCSSGVRDRWGGRLLTRTRPSLYDWCLEWPASWLFHQAAGPVQRSGSLPLPQQTLPRWWCFRAHTWKEKTGKHKWIMVKTS